MHRPVRRSVALAAAAFVVGAVATAPAAVAVAPPSISVVAAKANAVDRAFVRQMVPHHHMAVEMAELAVTRADHAKVKALAEEIISAQNGEIGRMREIAKRLGVKPASGQMDGAGHEVMMEDADTLGVTMDDMGMSMDMDALMDAKPFDRAFIDAMIAHHQGAIRMARAELEKGRDRRLRLIARDIVAAQKKEIRQLNTWRKTWYGAASPEGGVRKG